jgi:hypothetical protein
MKLFFGLGKDRPVAVCTDVRDCLPKGRKYQYQDGNSMAEAAKCWIAADEHLPRSIADVVGSNELITAHFEYPTKVWGGGIAMTDIMAFVPNGVIAVEAKVNERFDDVVSSWIFREEKKNAESPPHRTRVIQRYARVFGMFGAVVGCSISTPSENTLRRADSSGSRRLASVDGGPDFCLT